MRYLLRYHLRLGDIVRCFPIARHLRDCGHEVYFECLEQYHNVFELVDYVAPVAPGAVTDGQFDRVLDLQVWPARYDSYRRSGQTWSDYVFGLYPECEAVSDRRPRFDRVPELDKSLANVALVAPYGHSQVAHPDPEWLRRTVWRLGNEREIVFHLGPGMSYPYPVWVAPDIVTLCGAIKAAGEFFTVDSAPNILAAAVGRESWYYFPCPTPADGYSDDRQIRLSWKDTTGQWHA
jgi:hypothetical protein